MEIGAIGAEREGAPPQYQSVRSAGPQAAPGAPEATGAETGKAVTPASGADKAAALSEPRREEDAARAEQVAELKARDTEVRQHERAHAAAGAPHTGQPSYQYVKGPDGRNYAVAGEVPIDTSPVPGDPEATIAKAEQVKRAALAPAEPSSADRAVAAQADAMRLAALAELNTRAKGGAEEAQASAGPEQPAEAGVIIAARAAQEAYGALAGGGSTKSGRF